MTKRYSRQKLAGYLRGNTYLRGHYDTEEDANAVIISRGETEDGENILERVILEDIYYVYAYAESHDRAAQGGRIPVMLADIACYTKSSAVEMARLMLESFEYAEIYDTKTDRIIFAKECVEEDRYGALLQRALTTGQEEL